MGIKVIGAGFGRTGTKSLQTALESLGYGPCYHMTEVFAHPEHLPVWEAAARGEEVDWEDVFRNYQATVDWPGAAFYERIMEEYPEAKVILTVRDAERWYDSVSATIYDARRTASSPLFWLASRFVPLLRAVRRGGRLISKIAWEQTFENRFEDRAFATQTFKRLNEQVMERVPDEKLLVFEVKDGWEPLCEFLGVEPPDEPFPRLNDTRSFRRTTRQIPALAAAAVVTILTGLALFLLLSRKPR